MGSDTTVISFELDFGNSVENFNSLVTAGDKLNKTISDIRKNSTSILPETSTQFDDATQNINDTLQSMAKVNQEIKSGKLDSYQVGIKTDEFNNLSKSLSSIIADMQTIQKLTTSIGRQTTSYTQKQMKTLMPQLMGMARDATKVYSQSGSLASDDQILAAMKATQKYQTMRSSLLGKDTTGNIDDILRLAIIRGVGQTQRASFMNRLSNGSGLTKHVFDSFQDMLPVGFRKINTSSANISSSAFSKALKSNSESLTAKEAQSLYSLLLNNQFATEAAEAAKIAYRKNGELFIQKNVSRGMVKSMGAHLYDNLVNAAKGMEMYGITDINDPAVWDRIARKSNKRFMGNIAAARRLNDTFDWFEAERYSQKDFNKLINNRRTMYSAGQINFSPVPNSYEVAMYTLDDLKNNRNWNDRKKYSNYKDYHHIAVDESMHLNTIMRNSKGGIKKHNAYTDDVIYLEVDPRLSDPNLSEAERGALINQYAEVFQHGISGKGKNSANERYVFSRVNPKMGAEFIRKSVYDKINKEDKTYFSAGLNQTEFTDWKTFASSMEYRNKNATPGKSIQNLFGSEMPKNIVVVDLEDTTKGNGGAGLNGASIISNRLVQKGFQGRAHGIKTALTSVDIDQLVDAYGDQLYLTAYTGNEAEKGKRVKINKGVDMIVNAADLKNANTRFAGMTNEEITKIVQEDIQKGIYANRLYSDANGKTRWISGQLAQTLSFDKDASMMFARSFMDHYRNIGNYNYAMQYLFNEGETHDLLEKHPELFGSRLVQNRISDYRQAIMARMLRGDIMLPDEVSAYKGMAAPWLIDAFNADMQTMHNGESVSAFSQLPQETQKKLNSLTLGENRALFQKTLSSKLGLGRYPATAQSMQAVMNANTDKNIAKFAESIGLDPYGLYISTTSPLMQLLQGADFDGDVLEIIELATNEKKNASITKVMDKIVTATIKNNKKLYESGKISEEELERRDELLKRERNHGNSFSTNFSTAKGAKSASIWLSDYALQSSSLGTPHATVRNAFQMTPDSEIATALIDADRQYNDNSTEGKKGIGRNTSSEQLSVIGKYKPFSEWYRMVDKSRDEFGNIDPDELGKKNFFGVNLPSASMSGSMRSQNLARFIAKNFYGYDINDGYNWEEILKIAHGDIDQNTAVGRMKLGLKDTMLGIVNADYLAPSDVMVAQLLQLKARAQEEEEKRVANERQQGLLTDKDLRRSDSAIAKTRLSSQGGNVIDNLVTYALTQNSSILAGNRDMFGQLNQLGIKNLIGHTDLSKYISGEIASSEALKQEAEAKRLLQRSDILSQIATFDEETRAKKIDQLIFSPSLLSSLMKNPAGWAEHYLGGEEQDITPYTHLGWATHEAVEGFMRKRLAKATQENPTLMTDEELGQAAQEAVVDFEKYFDDNIGKKGLSKSDVKKLKNTDSYKNIKNYLSSSLVNLFPEEEYEVVAIEGATNASEKNSPLSFNVGKKINKNANGEEEDVESRGYFDLLVRNRKTGMYSMGDLKNYPHATAHDKAMWQMQQLLYASALPAYLSSKSLAQGELEGLNIIEPIQNRVSKINSSPEAIQDNLEKVQEGIRLIQSLSKNGFQMDQISAVSKTLDEMFGHNGFSNIADTLQQEQNRVEHIQSQISSNAGEGVGAALVMHDEYNNAMRTLSGINSFIWKKDPNKQDIRSNAWHRNYEQLEMQQGIVYDLENSQMNIQADMLKDQMDRTRLNLDTLLPKAAVQDLQEAYDLLKGINTEETTSKKANGKVEEFKNLTTQIEAASDAYDILKDKIKTNKNDLITKKGLLKQADNDEVKTKLQNEIAEIEAQNEIYLEASKNAGSIRSKLNSERKKYLKKNEADIWNELTQRQESLETMAIGGKTSNATSIVDEMSAYVKSVKQLKADAQLYAKEFGIDQDAEQYNSYMQGLNNLISTSAMTKYRNRVIEESFAQFNSRRGQIAGNVVGMRLSTDEQIDNAVKAQTEKIEQEKANIEARYKGSHLTKKQREEKQRLLDYYNRYNEDTYREQLQNNRQLSQQEEDIRLQQFLRQGEQMKRHMYGRGRGFVARALDQRDSNLSQWENRKLSIDKQISTKEEILASLKANGKGEGDTEYDKVAGDLAQLKFASEEAGNAIEKLSDPMSTAMAITSQFGDVVGRLAQRLGRQLFQKALQETKRFVKEFDSSMNEIQAITLKSDSEMQEVRSTTINKALGLRTSVSNVATTEAALYRQGLSDAEVSSRTESIIKFATVTKLNVAEATKIITTALQNDLVPSAEAAMDALVALGDSAATTAAEIGKGMQKAAASAKVAGVSYAELTALLTIGTSDTQLSGTQVGTALQTVFSRMRRLSISGYTADQNGEKTTANDAEAALKAVGVDLWDNKAIGKMRTAYEVLSDLSKVWQNLSDAQKNIVMNALAGTRQTNVFSTLMEGMSEDGGATLDKYLGLAEGSEGITQTKYEIAMQSLAAAMDEVKSSWDAVIESFVNSGAITGVLDMVSGFLQMVANAGSFGQGASIIAAGIVGISTALLALKSANPIIAALSTVIGIVSGLAAGGTIVGISNLINSFAPKTDEQKAEQRVQETNDLSKSYKNTADSYNSLISAVEKYGEAWDKVKNDENENNLRTALTNLTAAFPALSSEIETSLHDLTEWKNVVKEAKEETQSFVKDVAQNQVAGKIVTDIAANVETEYNKALEHYGVNVVQKYQAKQSLEKSELGDNSQMKGDLQYRLSSLAWNNKKDDPLYKFAKSVIEARGGNIEDYVGRGHANSASNTPEQNAMMAAVKEALFAENTLETDIIEKLYANKDKLNFDYKWITGNESSLITDEGFFNLNEYNKINEEGKYDKLALLSWLFDNSSVLQKELFNTNYDLFQAIKNNNATYGSNDTSRIPEDIRILGASYLDSIVQGQATSNSTAIRKFAANDTINNIIDQYEFGVFETEKANGETIKKALKNRLSEELFADYNLGEASTYFDANGQFLKDKNGNPLFIKLLELILSDLTSDVEKFTAENAPSDYYKYKVAKGNKIQQFETQDEAIKFVEKNKEYGYGDIYDNEGNAIYPSSELAIQTELLNKQEDKSAQNLAKAIKLITSDEIKSLKDLRDAYDKEGLGQELANVLSSKAELLGSYVATANGIMSFEDFQKSAKEMGVGRSSRADLVSNIFDYIQSGAISVEEFRTSPDFSGLYNTFKSLVGDAADAVLNAIEDGTYDASSDITKNYNKSVLSQKLKEKFQFDDYYKEASEYVLTSLYGTDLEKQTYTSSQRSEKQKFSNYNAAVERYASGDATAEDISLIASMGDFSEIELRNNRNNDSFRKQVVSSRNVRQKQYTDTATTSLDMLLEEAGITYDQYLNGLDEVITVAAGYDEALADYKKHENQIYESQESYIKGYQANHIKTGTRRDFIDPKVLASIDELLADTDYTVDEKGNLTYNPGKEEYISPSSVLYDEAKHNAITSKGRYELIIDAVDKNFRNINSLLTDKSYSELLQEDTDLQSMIKAGAPKEAIRNYANRKITGAKGSFEDNYGWLMDSLLGGTNTSEWSAEDIQKQWQSAQTNPELLKLYEQMLSEMAGGDIIRKIAQGEEANIDDAIEEYEKDYYTRLANKYGTENATAIGANRATLTQGTAGQRFVLTSQFAQRQIEAQNAQYYLNNWNGQSAGVLAQYLGVSEEEVKRADKKDLQTAIDENVRKMLIEQAESYGANLEGVDVKTSSLSDIKTALENALNNLDGEARKSVQNIIDLIDESGQLLGEKSDTLGSIAEQTEQQLKEGTYEYNALSFMSKNARIAWGNAYDNQQSIMTAFGNLEGWNPEWNNTIGQNQGVVAASSLYQQQKINGADYLDFLQMQMMGAGKDSTYYDMLASAVFGNGFQNGQFVSTEAMKAGHEAAQAGNGASLAWYKELQEKYGDTFTKAVEGDSKALEELNAQMAADKANDITKYSKGASNMASILAKMAKGGKDAANAQALLAKNMKSYQDQATAIDKARGKSGAQLDAQTKNILSGMFEGIDVNDIAKMTKDELAELLDGSQEAVNEAFTDDIQAYFDNAVSAAGMSGIQVDLSNISVDTNGEISLDELAAACDGTASEILAQIASMSGEYGHVRFAVDEKGNVVAVRGIVEKNAKGYHGGGGGGGGGKSAVDKLLEDQKFRVSEIQHRIKMTQIEEQQYDYQNNQTGYFDSIDKEISLQQQLKTEYANNIAEMRQQLASVKEGSEDWKKLTEAIWAAEEAMASINQTINEARAKEYTYIQKQQDYTDKKTGYTQSMYGIYAQRAMSQDRYKDYLEASQGEADAIRKQIEDNAEQEAVWYEQLKQTELTDDDTRRDLEEKILNIKQDTAQKENDLISKEREIAEQRLAQISKVLQADIMTEQSVLNTNETFGQMYQTEGRTDEYVSLLKQNRALTTSVLSSTKTARDAALQNVKDIIDKTGYEGDYTKFNPADYADSENFNQEIYRNAVQALYQYDESVAQLTVDLENLVRAENEAAVQKITDKYTDMVAPLEAANNQLATLIQHAKESGDTETANNLAAESIKNSEGIAEAYAKEAKALKEFYENTELDPEERRRYYQMYTEAAQKALDEEVKIATERHNLQKSEDDDLLQRMSDRESGYEHNLKLVQYEETRYMNRGELTNYGTILRQEQALHEQNRDALTEEIATLEARLEEVKDNEEESRRLTDTLKKKEEQLKNENNTLEANNKKLKENEEKIRQVRFATENAVNKEIENQKKIKRDMLNSEVQLQNSILDVIRNRYQEEWKLMKKDIEEQKKQLNEEKNILAERVNAKRNATEAENKQEELAELQRQYALISADTTRTKDANELLDKIQQLQKEIAYGKEDELVAARQKAIDDQVSALSDYEANYEEDLNEWLANSNNLSDEFNEVLSGDFEGFMEYMKVNNRSYRYASPEAREQMENSWNDTWKVMRHILENNQEEIDRILQTEDSFIEYMQQSDEYLNAGSDKKRQSLTYQYEKLYEDMIAAERDDNPVAEIHDHDIPEIINSLENIYDAIYDVDLQGRNRDPIDVLTRYLFNTDYSDGSKGINNPDVDFSEIGTKVEQEAIDNAINVTPTGSGSGSSGNQTYKATALASFYGASGQVSYTATAYGTSQEEADKKAVEEAMKKGVEAGYSFNSSGSGLYHGNTNGNVLIDGETQSAVTGAEYGDYFKEAITTIKAELAEEQAKEKTAQTETLSAIGNGITNVAQTLKDAFASFKGIFGFASGGLVDFTGPAWVDGTKAHPESFLDATDTELLRNMLDTFTYVKSSPYMTHINSDNFSKGGVNVGDINVNLYEAKLEDDADYNEIALKVGKAFTKELEKDGFNLAGYTW